MSRKSNNDIHKVAIPGGYCTVSADTLSAHLMVRDYRGDVRSVIAEDGRVEEWNDYYPYGMAFYNPSAAVQPWKHSGKEHESRLGLHWLDFGARCLDFAKGQWTTMDPLADKSPWQSPYAYCGGDPVNYVDPDGKIKIIAIKNDNSVINNFALIQNALEYPDNDTAIHIFCHGSPKGIILFLSDCMGPLEVHNIEDVDLFQNSFSFNKVDLLSNEKDLGEKFLTMVRFSVGKNDPMFEPQTENTFVLHACSTGKNTNNDTDYNTSFAAMLSRQLPNAKIVAPSEDLGVTASMEETIHDGGKWLMFQNGVVVQTFECNDLPYSR